MQKRKQPAPRSARRFSGGKDMPGHHEKSVRAWNERDREKRKSSRRHELSESEATPARPPARFPFPGSVRSKK